MSKFFSIQGVIIFQSCLMWTLLVEFLIPFFKLIIAYFIIFFFVLYFYLEGKNSKFELNATNFTFL